MNSFNIHCTNDGKRNSYDELISDDELDVTSLLKSNFNTFNDLQRAVITESSVEVFDFINSNLNLKKSFKDVVFSSNKPLIYDDIDFSNIKGIIDFKRVNSLRYINSHFRSVNKLLALNGIFIGRAETYSQRKSRIYKKYGKIIGKLFWRADFIFNRIIPKLPIFNKIYFFLIRRVRRPVSQAELLGRLVYCGFKIENYKLINDVFYFAAKKIKEPLTTKASTGHPLIRLQRIGKGGEMIGVYKFRTMHPYSEFIQDLVIEMNGYNDKGKPANDFRLTTWGKLLRRLWLDEFPQIINVVKGDMKIVGIRPISKVRFSEFPDDLQKERIKHKPGCFPPYVALCMPDEDGNIEAERIYLKDKTKHPYTTDIKYFFKSVYNIAFNKIRSA